VFSGNLTRFPQWEEVMARARADRDSGRVCAGGAERDCLPRAWLSLIERVKDLPTMAKLEAVNCAMNAHPYVPTWQNWHKSMYWDTPSQFFAKGG
jgi:hypothetical protein